MAVDTSGNVYSWGLNDKGQLGHPVEAEKVNASGHHSAAESHLSKRGDSHAAFIDSCEHVARTGPRRVKLLSHIAQVFAGEYQSFAVDTSGELFAWGLNKNNCLLVNHGESGMAKTIVEEPMPVKLPAHFGSAKRKHNVVENNCQGFEFYAAEKPVKSSQNLLQLELSKVTEECTKLRKKVKDFQLKIDNLERMGSADDKGGAAGKEGDPQDEEQDTNFGEKFEKVCNNDKVIQNIGDLMAENELQITQVGKEMAKIGGKAQSAKKECENLKEQLAQLERDKEAFFRDIQGEIDEAKAKFALPTDKAQLKGILKGKEKEKKEIESANKARETTLQDDRQAKMQLEYKFNTQYNLMKNKLQTSQENKSIFLEVINERKHFLKTNYLMKGQDDLEQILESLHDHWKFVKLTSFEQLARENPSNLSAKQLLEESNSKL